MALFSAGQIVRTVRNGSYLSTKRNGQFVDWNARATAQGWIVTVHGATDTFVGGTVVDPANGLASELSVTSVQRYTVRVFDIDAQDYVDADYPEAQLVAGSVDGGVLIGTGSFDAPATNAQTANLVRSRLS